MRTQQGIINLITVYKQHVSLSFINDVLESFVTKKYKLLHSMCSRKKNPACIWPTSCCTAQGVLSQYCYGLAFTTILFGDLITRCKKSAYTILWGLCLIRIDNFVIKDIIKDILRIEYFGYAHPAEEMGFSRSAFASRVCIGCVLQWFKIPLPSCPEKSKVMYVNLFHDAGHVTGVRSTGVTPGVTAATRSTQIPVLAQSTVSSCSGAVSMSDSVSVVCPVFHTVTC